MYIPCDPKHLGVQVCDAPDLALAGRVRMSATDIKAGIVYPFVALVNPVLTDVHLALAVCTLKNGVRVF